MSSPQGVVRPRMELLWTPLLDCRDNKDLKGNKAESLVAANLPDCLTAQVLMVHDSNDVFTRHDEYW